MATYLIRWYLKANANRITKVVSGGATGIDSLAISTAKRLGFDTQEYLPENPRWEPDGYKDRNMTIGQVSDEILCISAVHAAPWVAEFLADYASELGKTVFKFLV